MNILGISAYYHDSAAVLMKDGKIIAAAQEERFTRKKHDHSFPRLAIEFCLKKAGIAASQLDYVGFYDKPFIKFERILYTYMQVAPRGIASFIKAMPLWLHRKLWLSHYLRKELGYQGPLVFPEHHESHAASAFFSSPYEKAAILTADGVGEWTTTSCGIGDKNQIKLIKEIKFPHSIGLLYSAFTYYIGFRVNSGEYKVMGLAPYGQPKYADLIKKELIDLKEDGSFRLNMKYFGYLDGLTMTNARLNKLFGGPPRTPETAISVREFDLARSIQEVTEEIMLKMVRHIHQKTGLDTLCLAGGVALNCVANGRILRESPFKQIFIQPAAGDAGGALGVAQFIWYQLLDNERQVDGKTDAMQFTYLGPQFSDEQIRQYLTENDIPFGELGEEDLSSKVAKLITEKQVVGWFQGSMEFGPRALGNRSILADARTPEMKDTVNLKIKFRETFRPFAPAVAVEAVSEYFQIDQESPYMLLVAAVREGKRVIPAVTHVDHSARIQSVSLESNPKFYRLIKEYEKLTGIPVIINTSFNVRGEPIVCTPEDAYRCFRRSKMDYLVLGSFLLDKGNQPPFKEEIDWQQTFPKD